MEKDTNNPENIVSDNDPTSGGEARKSTGRSKDSSSAAVIGELNKIIRLKKRMKSAASKRPQITVEDKQSPQRPPTAPLSQISAKKSYLDLKTEFGKHLPRLGQLDTRQTALKDLGTVIETHKTPEALRVYLSVLAEYKRPQNFTANEAEVFLLGLISDTFGQELIDQIDNPPSLLAATMRFAGIVAKYFKDPNENVQRQCCKTWKQIYRSQLLNAPNGAKFDVLYAIPAASVLGGKDRVAQITAIMVIESTLELAQKLADKELVASIASKYLPSIYFKIFLDTPSLISCVRLIIEIALLKTLQQFMVQLLQKTLSFLVNNETRPISYKIKSEACDLLAVVAKQLQDLSSAVIGNYHEEIIPILMESCKDRTLKVQGSAKAALKEWNLVKQKWEELEKKKLTKKLLSKDQSLQQMLDPDEIIGQKTSGVSPQLQILQKKPIQQPRTVVLENDLGMKNVLHREGAWVKELKGKNFVRKQTGVGGGRTALNEERLKKQGAWERSANVQAMRLKQLVLRQEGEGNNNELGSDQQERRRQDIEYQQMQLQQQQKALRDGLKTLKKAREEKAGKNQQERMKEMDLMFDKKDNEINQQQNEFYNSSLQQLAEIQKQQQRLIEEQLKMYDNNKDNRNEEIDNQEVGNKNHGNNRNKLKQVMITQEENNNDYADELEDTQDFNSPGGISLNNLRNNKKNMTQSAPVNSSISATWKQAVNYADDDNMESAYQLILDSEDDIYLIRLLLRTGMPLQKLTRQTAVRTVQRYIMIQKSNFVNRLCSDFYEDCQVSGLAEHLVLQDHTEMLANQRDLLQENDKILADTVSW